MKQIERGSVDTCIGRMTFYADEQQLVRLSFEDSEESASAFLRRYLGKHTIVGAGKTVMGYAEQMLAFLAGERRAFDIPYTLYATPFQKKVLEAVATIPYGQVYSYKDVGTLIGSAGYRAVGGAVKANPLAIVIPCHRVVASNGIGGYSMAEGLKTKQFLLLLEKKND